MKKVLLMMAALPLVFLGACSDDDDKELPVSPETITGIWGLSKVNGENIPGVFAVMTIYKEKVVVSFSITYEDGGISLYKEEYVYTLSDGGKVHMENHEDNITMDITIKKLTKDYLKVNIDNWESSMGGLMDYKTVEFFRE